MRTTTTRQQNQIEPHVGRGCADVTVPINSVIHDVKINVL